MLCIGLDPDLALMPEGYGADDVAEFNIAIIEATSDLVCAYKPNVAFYEALGPERGYAALRATLAAIPPHVITLADAKRGDVEHTARAYAQAIFDDLGFDAATVNPYLGLRLGRAVDRAARQGGDHRLPHVEPGRAGLPGPARCSRRRRAAAVRGRRGAGAVVGSSRERRPRGRRDVSGRDAPAADALSGDAVPGAGHRRAAGIARGRGARGRGRARARTAGERVARRHVRVAERGLRGCGARVRRSSCATRSAHVPPRCGRKVRRHAARRIRRARSPLPDLRRSR